MRSFDAKKIILPIIFFILLIVAVFTASEVLKRKNSYYYKDQFFESEVPYDVLFFGSSHMHEGIDPVYLWENHGISSYNLASAGESIQMSYYVMKAALEHAKPKAVIIDSYKISDKKDSIDEGYAYVHESIDALPLSKDKLEAIDYASRFFDGGKIAFLSNIYAYHGRYTELEKDDFVRNINYDKGAYIMTEMFKAEAPDLDSYITDIGELKDGDGVCYYKKIIELCKEKGVIPILVNIPANRANYSEKTQKQVNALMKYTEDNGGMAINFLPLLDDIGINYDTDFGDASHLNFMGAAKTADYIAEFLRNNLGMEDHRNDRIYSDEWGKVCSSWKEQKIELLKKKKDAVAYIFLAEDESRDINVYMLDPEKTSAMYGLDFCLDRTGIIPEKKEEDEMKGFDMIVEVRNKDDGKWLATQYFRQNDGGKYMAVEE
ncbi:MAG: DUF1574 domain-containing protein [Lachnospiraceae bacterium]|nr:DUF1574 domain-containing protein [Lachnospiraceae bacterium]